MITVTIHKVFKSLQPVSPFELPDFCVLTGKNGSGKSHLFEAMSKRNVTTITIGGKHVNTVQYVPFNGLNPDVGADCNYRQLLDEQKNIWNAIKSYINSHKSGIPSEDVFYRDIISVPLKLDIMNSIRFRSYKSPKIYVFYLQIADFQHRW